MGLERLTVIGQEADMHKDRLVLFLRALDGGLIEQLPGHRGVCMPLDIWAIALVGAVAQRRQHVLRGLFGRGLRRLARVPDTLVLFKPTLEHFDGSLGG